MIVIQIGNSDNKLSQQEWSRFWYAVDDIVKARCQFVHFSGISDGNAPWQNAAWVANPLQRNLLIRELGEACETYNQDSIAIIEGEVAFVTKENNQYLVFDGHTANPPTD